MDMVVDMREMSVKYIVDMEHEWMGHEWMRHSRYEHEQIENEREAKDTVDMHGSGHKGDEREMHDIQTVKNGWGMMVNTKKMAAIIVPRGMSGAGAQRTICKMR